MNAMDKRTISSLIYTQEYDKALRMLLDHIDKQDAEIKELQVKLTALYTMTDADA